MEESMQMMMKMPNGVRSGIHVLYCTLDTIFTRTITLTILVTCDKKGEIFTFFKHAKFCQYNNIL